MKNIFVSSTFKDFQYERDVLHRKVLPKLNALAKNYGDVVHFCDLRWGVDTSEASNEQEIASKVLDVCLEEIDRSHPYMLIFLGERYGFAPGKEIINQELNRKDRMLELENIDISITALEIEYGALGNKRSLENTFFFFREMKGNPPAAYNFEDEVCKEKLLLLKERIMKLAGDSVHFYNASYESEKVILEEDFENKLINCFKNLFHSQWQAVAKLNSFEKELKLHHYYRNEKVKNFYGYQAFAKEIVQSFNQVDRKIIALKGASGAGKSTLVSKICSDMEEEGYVVIAFFSGITSMSTNAYDILNTLVYETRNLAYNNQDIEITSNLNDAIEGVAQACDIITEHKKLVIVVDALDQLASNEFRDTLAFLPLKTAPYTKILVSCLDDYQLPEEIPTICMPSLQEEELKGMLDANLISIGKRLPKIVKEEVIKKESAKNPLYIYYTLKILTMMDKEDFKAIAQATAQRIVNKKKQQKEVDINEDMESFTQYYLQIMNALPDSLEQLAAVLLEKIADRTNPSMSSQFTSLIGSSRHGLTESHLEVFVDNFSRLTFAQYTHYISELFMLRDDGRWDFLHQSLRKGAEILIEKYSRSAYDYGDEKLEVMLQDFKKNSNHLSPEKWVEASTKISERSFEILREHVGPYAFSRNVTEPHKMLFILFKNRYRANTRVSLENPVDAIAMEELTYHSIKANEQYFLVEYLAEIYDDATYNSTAVQYLIKDIISYSMQDGGAFLKSFAKSFSSGAFIMEYVKLVSEFFSYTLIDSFGSKLNELEIKVNVLQSCISLNQYLVEYYDNNTIYIDRLADNYSALIDTLQTIGDDRINEVDGLRKEFIALKLKNVEDLKIRLKENEKYEIPTNLRYMYIAIANTYNEILNNLTQMKEEQDTSLSLSYSEKALEYYKKALAIEEDSNIKYHIFNMLWIIAFLFTCEHKRKDYDRALRYYDECITHLPYAVHWIEEELMIYYEAQLVAEKAWVCKHNEDKEKALTLYRKSIELAEEGLSANGINETTKTMLVERIDKSKNFIAELIQV